MLAFTVAEPLPAASEYVINPPLPKVALVVVVAVKLPSTFKLFAEVMLSVFIRDPQFQSQTKDRLTSPEAARMVENAVRDHFGVGL